MFELRINVSSKTKLGDLIIEYPNVLIALELLNIRLGFGDKNLKQMAETYGINYTAFETIISVYCSKRPHVILSKDALNQILTFLRASHKYFRGTQVPQLKEQIFLFSKQIPLAQGDILTKFFEGYISEINEHFKFEDNLVFPYIDTMLFNTEKTSFDITIFESNHTDIEQKLLDLRNILIKYIPEDTISPYRRLIMRELLALEISLDYHTFIEDNILIPSVRTLEVKRNTKL